MKNRIKLYFYKILGLNLDIDKSKLFYLVINNTKLYSNTVIYLLLKYKSYCNSEKTNFYIDKLKDNNYDYILETLYYLTNNKYCCIIKYKDYYERKENREIVVNTDIDFKDETINTFVYKDEKYTNDQILKGIKYSQTYYKYQLKEEFITNDFLYLREYYLDKTVRVPYVI